jgi:hypothetical protein
MHPIRSSMHVGRERNEYYPGSSGQSVQPAVLYRTRISVRERRQVRRDSIRPGTAGVRLGSESAVRAARDVR